jgi:hypothetical protein
VTAPSAGSAEINLRAIRSHEGSQARAWEELAYQLRPAPRSGHLETRKTRAPDAGVEWYELYDDGHQEGFQAKFHECLQDALGGMRESVEAVCSKRPDLTKLTFVVPYDFTDSGLATTKTDQDRWDAAVSRWRTDVPGASGIEFATIRAGDIISTLARAEHAGRRAYWFGGVDITDDWLRNRFLESERVADKRYTPEADSASSINAIIDATSCGPTFLETVRSVARRASTASRHDRGMWGPSAPSASALIDSLDEARAASFGSTVDAGEVLPSDVPDLAGMAETAASLLDLAYAQADSLPPYERRNLDEAISALQSLSDLGTSTAARAMSKRAIAVVGPAGQGKTHALMHAVDACLQRGVPALAVLGQRLSDKNWWPAVADTLDGMAVGSDEFLQALDSMAEARRCRALVIVDAINESQSPSRWRDELPAMLAQFEKYPHLALVVSYRTDYREVVGAPDSLLKVRHPGFAGHEHEALRAYCELFDIPVPTKALFEPAFASPLFLRMYCEIMASDPLGGSDTPTRSTLFERYAAVMAKNVVRKLNLPPTSGIVDEALTRVADLLLRKDGRPIPRATAEEAVDALLPGRTWPGTLFQQLASEGLLELRPTHDGTESASFPFQAYSEHLLAARLLAQIDSELATWFRRLTRTAPRTSTRHRKLAKRIESAPWSWRSLAVMLPEREGIELIDLLPACDDFRLDEALRESLTDRTSSAFGARALELLRQLLIADTDGDAGGVEVVLALAPREGHPGNADWLHEYLVPMRMAERDATWSIAAFRSDEYSEGYRRLTDWAKRLSGGASRDEVRLASIALMWLLTSPNRFLRDHASKTLITMLCADLEVAADLVAAARHIDDPYVQERVLTCTYGAVLVSGDEDRHGAHAVLESLTAWCRAGLPIDVIARDSARGIAAWSVDRGLLDASATAGFHPPYGAPPPDEPPTREELEANHGPVKDAHGNYTEWRASSILHSCLDWYGDFNKYVVKSDVEFFSWHPLDGPAPTAKEHDNPVDEVDVDWAGRWIANRAIALGWTTDRFEAFERDHDLRRGRDAHKAERFGKKYQWIAHRELLARLADNFHPAHETWSTTQAAYEGPWVWYGRDFDPTLPPSVRRGGSQVCLVAQDSTASWATLTPPAMDVIATPDQWVAKTDDLPGASAMFACDDPDGRRWIAIQRYSTWSRDNAQRRGMTKRERDVFFLQFSWLVPRGRGGDLYDFIERAGLSGRWMPDTSRTHHHYLGEASSAPIVTTASADAERDDIPTKLAELGIRPRPAVERYLWEGNSLDCSIDESVDFYVPTSELLDSARWVGHRAEWAVSGEVVARSVHYPDGENGQDVLLVDAEWLTTRLRELDADMVIGTLSERHSRPLSDDDHRNMAYSDVWYVALATPAGGVRHAGPFLEVRRKADD